MARNTDYWREKGYWADMFTKMSVGDLLILDWEQLNLFTGDTFRAELHLSHMCVMPIINGVVKWEVEGTDIGGVVEGIKTGEGFDVLLVTPISFKVPDVSPDAGVGKACRIIARLYDGERLINENEWEIYVYPKAWSKPSIEKFLNCPMYHSLAFDDVVPNALKSMGWEHSSLLYTLGVAGFNMYDGFNRDNPVAVLHKIDELAEDYIKGGGTAILIATGAYNCNLFKRNGLRVAFMGGGGPGKVNFIRKESGIGKRVPFDNPLLWPFYKAGPRVGLVGLDPANNEDIIAGYFGHFVNFQDTYDPQSRGVAGSITKLKYGKGKILVSTFRVSPRNNNDPAAKIILEDIIIYALNGFEAMTELK